MRRALLVFLPLVAAGCGDDRCDAAEMAPSPVPTPPEAAVTTETPRTNRLAGEKSAYLLQHARNPVDWYPWGEAAFAKAKAENKPVFLSIGYSSCHWCHVMEHESFEDEEVAKVLNEHFVSIKVDREERPDVDEVYMKAAQAMGGGGGWPLSVWLTPEGKPFFAGTYFPKEPRMGMPGFLDLLERIAETWADEEKRALLVERGEQAQELVAALYGNEEPAELGPEALTGAKEYLEMGYDADLGGFASPPSFAPKFPSPSMVELALRAALRDDDGHMRNLATHTLDRMARGGIHDHVGGGFHRYSVTRDWLVPHFEKMLYDNAQLLGLYAWAHQVTGSALYAETARDIAQWVRREMTGRHGGFYAAQDADDPGGPEGEGGFYVWDPGELEELFGEREAEILKEWFHVSAKGNWFVNGRQEKPGKSILQVRRPAASVAKEFSLAEEELKELVARAEARMYEAREKRPKPMTDTKVITSWNALMISGFCRAHQALGDESYKEAAVRAGEFLFAELVEDGHVKRRWSDGEAAHAGILDDYAFLVAACLDLWETTFDRAWLERALELADRAVELFWDPAEGGFFYTAKDAEELLARGKVGTDQAKPSGNGVMAMSLLRIAELTGDQAARERAAKTIAYFGTQATNPYGYASLLNALDFAQGAREIFIAGPAGDPATRALVEAVWADPRPNRVLALVLPGLEELLPPARGKTPVDGAPAAYVCRNYTCEAPVTDPAELGE